MCRKKNGEKLSNRISLIDLEALAGVNANRNLKNFYKDFQIQYESLSAEQRDMEILEILKKIHAPLQTVGAHRSKVWEAGWKENVDDYKKSGNKSSLLPKYFGKTRIFRYMGKLVLGKEKFCDYKLHAVMVDLVLSKYLTKDIKQVHEFGCGTGLHLDRFADWVEEDIKLNGYDWTETSGEMIDLINNNSQKKIRFEQFNFFRPRKLSKSLKDGVIITCAALEQVGTDFRMFINFLLDESPSLVIHLEPFSELLDENNLLDYLSIQYCSKRNYLKGLLNYLESLATEGVIEIIERRRLFCGSRFLEGYPVVVWRVRH